MSSIMPGYEYDIFISYRQKDNKQDGWVTEFVRSLRSEIEATFKEDISIYFDENPDDGLLESHDVDQSLKDKIKCLVFIPIISHTYCDPSSFAWQKEFIAFRDFAIQDQFGMDVGVSKGNVSKRILPVRIHEIDPSDTELYEKEINAVMRPIDFIYREPGVNRSLRPGDSKSDNLNGTSYRNQVNKVANALKEIISGLSIEVGTDEKSERKEAPKRKRSLRSEIKRRNIVRAGIIYVLSSLVLWKAILIGIDSNLLNPVLNKISLLVLILLFPIAMALAWLYERSPDGFIRTGSLKARHNPFTDSQKKPLTSNTFIVIILLTAVTIFVIFPGTGKTDNNLALEKSIAVLPFVDMSTDQDQEYFSDGLSEELLNVLAKTEGIQVAGRTSSFSYKGKNENIRTIAEELGVNYILEGSVRKSGNTLRITAQLIKAANGFHLWSETYDREYTAEQLFEIQDEIAISVLSELQLQLLPRDTTQSDQPTTNVDAYNLYLQATQLEASRRAVDIEQAIEKYKKAVALDPEFSRAFARLAIAYNLLNAFGNLPADQMKKQMNENIQRSLLLNADEPYSYLAMAKLQHDEGNYDEAIKAARKALDINPNLAEAHRGLYEYMTHHSSKEDAEKADKHILKAFEIDPRSPVIRSAIARHYWREDNYDKVLEIVDETISMNPEFADSYRIKSDVFRHYPFGDLDKAFIHMHEAYLKEPDNISSMTAMFQMAEDLDLLGYARQISELISEKYPENATSPYLEYRINAIEGKYDQALTAVDRYYELQKNPSNAKYKFAQYADIYPKLGTPEIAIEFGEREFPSLIGDSLEVNSDNWAQAVDLYILYKIVDNETKADALAKAFLKYDEIPEDTTALTESGKMWLYINSLVVKGELEEAAEMLDKQYFVDKSKAHEIFGRTWLFSQYLAQSPRYLQYVQDVDKDIARMRDEAILYLKEVREWQEGWEKQN